MTELTVPAVVESVTVCETTKNITECPPCDGSTTSKRSLEAVSKHALKLAKLQFLQQKLMVSPPPCGGVSSPATEGASIEDASTAAPIAAKPTQKWCCCGTEFNLIGDIHKHINLAHTMDIQTMITEIKDSKRTKVNIQDELIALENDPIPFPSFLKDSLLVEQFDKSQPPKLRVLLFYKYGAVNAPRTYKAWLTQVAEHLHLSGKLRLASEGLNGTVAGTYGATELFMRALIEHAVLSFSPDDFKQSFADNKFYVLRGGVLHNKVFDALSVRIQEELVPVGVSREISTPENTGTHLSPAEFHEAVRESIERPDDVVLIDCRNDYEYDVGRFEGAQLPPVRRFSDFSEYVHQVKEEYANKKVLMYCTGGIRCERATSFMKSVGIDNVYHLKGGIHKYLDEYPDGYYRGKLFVFDNRRYIKTNESVVGHCRACKRESDVQILCPSYHCKIFIIVCAECQAASQANHYCCEVCRKHDEEYTKAAEECPNKKIKPANICPCRIDPPIAPQHQA